MFTEKEKAELRELAADLRAARHTEVGRKLIHFLILRREEAKEALAQTPYEDPRHRSALERAQELDSLLKMFADEKTNKAEKINAPRRKDD